MKYKELYDEYNSFLSQQREHIEISRTLRDGYISTKTISGKQYAYLQKRVDGKLNSEYIKEDMLPEVQSELQKRGEIEKAISQASEHLTRLEAAAKVLDKSLYHKLIILRRCSLMDSMPVDIRKKSLEFGNAMTALEGIPASEDTEKTLSLWAIGQHSFKDSYLQTLRKYNLIESVK
jgi:hypothetical protein